MNIVILGAAGFIGTNLANTLMRKSNSKVLLVGSSIEHFSHLNERIASECEIRTTPLAADANFDSLVKGQDVVFHLMSSTVPATANRDIAAELQEDIVRSANLLDACVRRDVGRVVFISSGGTVYGKDERCPISEDAATNPITAYGLQKLAIEKLIYLYGHLYGLDYRIVRLANPYGPYQRPNGVLGAVTTFVYKALRGELIEVYGDGNVVRDFIFIDDAIRGICAIADGAGSESVFNLGCGYGTSINELLSIIETVLSTDINVKYDKGRKSDVPVNYLDISRYEKTFGLLKPVSLEDGIKRTACFLEQGLYA